MAVLATWRGSHLLWAEDGPWNVTAQVRAWAGSRQLRVFDCFYCLSLWVALPAAFLIACFRPAPLALPSLILNWLALSGGSILIERLTATTAAPAAVWRDEPPQG